MSHIATRSPRADVDNTALPFGSAAVRGQAPDVDNTALPFGSAAVRGQAPDVDNVVAQTLLAVGLGMPGTGATRVLSALLEASPHRVHWMALGAMPQASTPLRFECLAWPFSIDDKLTAIELARRVRQVLPEVVLLVGQPMWLAPLLEALHAFRPALRVVVYAPIEGRLVDPVWLEPLRFVDDCILYTEHARRSVRACAGDRPLPALHVLPHGVDLERFHVLGGSRARLRASLFPERPELADAFIVLNPSEPQLRKRIDLTIRGFAQFAKDKRDAYLYLHHVRLTQRRRAQLEALARDAGIADRLLLNELNPTGAVVSDAELNQLYNACDVGLSTAMGEGWGLTSFEHAATRAAQIVPDHTSFRENWTGAAELVETTGVDFLEHEYAEMHTVSEDGVAEALERLYREPGLRDRRADAALTRAMAPTYRWDAIAERLDEILRGTERRAPAVERPKLGRLNLRTVSR